MAIRRESISACSDRAQQGSGSLPIDDGPAECEDLRGACDGGSWLVLHRLRQGGLKGVRDLPHGDPQWRRDAATTAEPVKGTARPALQERCGGEAVRRTTKRPCLKMGMERETPDRHQQVNQRATGG